MFRRALVAGTIAAGLAVILGAFGAHALKEILEEKQLMVYETGVRYQFYHSFALLAAGALYRQYPDKKLRYATGCFITGILLFSGSLYAMTILWTQNMTLGPIGALTPIGGLFFIAGWVLMLMAVARKEFAATND